MKKGECICPGAYTATLYVMVNIIKGSGRAPPPPPTLTACANFSVRMECTSSGRCQFSTLCVLCGCLGQTHQIFFLEPFFFRKPNIRWRPFPFLLDLIFWLDVSIERGELIENFFKKYIVNQPFSIDQTLVHPSTIEYS
jgi:hypothetical protein